MLIGYARVSTPSQDLQIQLQALREAGCTHPRLLFTETASGGRWERPELHRMLEQLREGDVVVVYKLDRLSRSLKDLLVLLERIHQAGAGFRSLTEQIDTTSAAGRMMMQMLGAFAEFEREMIRERTMTGLAAARAQGRVGGRRPALTKDQRQAALEMLEQGSSQAQVAHLFEVSRSTISRLAAQQRQQRQAPAGLLRGSSPTEVASKSNQEP